MNNSFHCLNNAIRISITLFHPHVFSRHLNNVTRTTLSNGTVLFNEQFSLFKQHNTYFYNTFSPTCISTTLKQRYRNNITKQAISVSNWDVWFCWDGKRIKLYSFLFIYFFIFLDFVFSFLVLFNWLDITCLAWHDLIVSSTIHNMLRCYLMMAWTEGFPFPNQKIGNIREPN